MIQNSRDNVIHTENKTKKISSFFRMIFVSSVLYIKKFEQKRQWYRWWDSNPHGFPHDFESFKLINICLLLILINNF